jgi:glycosyltransferase involved in cell wall biosynthesis
VTTETCERYYRLGAEEIQRLGPLEHVAPAAGSVGLQTGGSEKNLFLGTLRAGKAILFGNQLPDEGVLSPGLAAWIEAFKPQVLYTILGSNAMMDLVDAIQRRYALPLVVHMMDDWPETSYRGGALGFVAREHMETTLRGLLGRASARLGICDAMCEAYGERYGVAFQPFQNAVDATRWARHLHSHGEARRPAEIVYAGSILPQAQLDTLADCCEAVARLARDGLELRLSIYSPRVYAEPHRARLAVAPQIRLLDALTDDAQFFETIAGADALLLPANFDPGAVRFLRYSMPTKVPAYLLSGTPILAYGPREIAQVRYAIEAGWARVVSERGVPGVAQALRELLGDRALRESLSARARETALERHEAAVVRAGFQDVLRRVSG